ncbi:hypothetical protein VPH5P1C_0252 [Vibrio phage 5P1c]|nr:hypothetical protein VP495E541_P0258 [Vibrio phage 495E54-1]
MSYENRAKDVEKIRNMRLERIEEVLGSDAFYYAKEDQDASVLIDLLEEIEDIVGEK